MGEPGGGGAGAPGARTGRARRRCSRSARLPAAGALLRCDGKARETAEGVVDGCSFLKAAEAQGFDEKRNRSSMAPSSRAAVAASANRDTPPRYATSSIGICDDGTAALWQAPNNRLSNASKPSNASSEAELQLTAAAATAARQGPPTRSMTLLNVLTHGVPHDCTRVAFLSRAWPLFPSLGTSFCLLMLLALYQ